VNASTMITLPFPWI